jgi:hypothetical protein
MYARVERFWRPRRHTILQQNDTIEALLCRMTEKALLDSRWRHPTPPSDVLRWRFLSTWRAKKLADLVPSIGYEPPHEMETRMVVARNAIPPTTEFPQAPGVNI